MKPKSSLTTPLLVNPLTSLRSIRFLCSHFIFIASSLILLRLDCKVIASFVGENFGREKKEALTTPLLL